MDTPIVALLALAAVYLSAVNLLAFAAFGLDKKLAQSGSRRISEANLLALAFAGGSPGAYAGRQLFRHKTRKQPFSNALHNIVIFQLLALTALGGWLLFR